LTKVNISQVSNREDHPDGYRYGRSFPIRIIWHFINAIVFQSQVVPLYGIKVRLLRLFGAKLGTGVKIKPGVCIKYPWYLEIGDHVWLGENVWLENGNQLTIGSHVVLSQGAYVCNQSRDWADPLMGGITKPVVIEDGAWVSSFAKVFLGVTIGEEAIVTPGTVVTSNLEPRGIYRGNPAEKIGERRIRDYPGPKREPGEPAAAEEAVAS
jgi:putative colanic acid biosynthesis acetyltransferase WcaF